MLGVNAAQMDGGLIGICRTWAELETLCETANQTNCLAPLPLMIMYSPLLKRYHFKYPLQMLTANKGRVMLTDKSVTSG